MVSKNYTIWSAWKGTKSLMFSAKKLSNSQREIKTIFFPLVNHTPLVLSPKLFGLFGLVSHLCHVMLLPYFLPVNALLMQIELGNRKTFSPSSFLSVSQNNSELLLVFPSSAQLLLVWLQHISLCQDENWEGPRETGEKHSRAQSSCHSSSQPLI